MEYNMWEKYEVMSEFLKIAQDRGIIKNDEVSPNPYQEDLKTIEEKKNVITGEKEYIIEKSHPESVYVADAREDGGLVENQWEQHNKIMDAVNKMPRGVLAKHYVSLIDSLIKTANQCDTVGESDAADILTNAAGNLVSYLKSDPF